MKKLNLPNTPSESTMLQADGNTENTLLPFLEMFKRNVHKLGNSYAIESQETKLTYLELDSLSNRLSCFLRDSGVKKGDFIGLCLPSNALWIITLLAILKSGAVYFPIDPTYPLDRIEYMISHTRPKMILSSHEFAKIFSELNIRYIDIEHHCFACNANAYNSRLSLMKIFPDDIAYVIYSSGSTGSPKGIQVTHKNLCNIYRSRQQYYPKKFRGLISGGICFDASLLVAFYALASGGCLCLLCFGPSENIPKLKHFIDKFHVNYMISVPSLYYQFLTNGHKVNLQCVSLTGEQLPKSVALLHAKLTPKTQLLNEYGPSEYAIGTTLARIYLPKNKSLQEISIGSPLPNTDVYILDEKLQTVPIGEKGEIYISGVGLSKGYIADIRLTSKKFIYINLDGNQNCKVYKTGDIGRYITTQEIEYIGRIEQQTVFNHRKVYLGEIENAFYQHPNILSAIAFVQSNRNAEEIVACFSETQRIAFDELYDFLEKKLTPDLIPSRLIKFDQFPLSPNGKIDRDIIRHTVTSRGTGKFPLEVTFAK
ncbi:MAG: amino acid adenylation domain-containing protein [Chlamydiales bacterium]|nr:amino acid adenylation domain-containing protein [Chlamydiales bacterium]